MADKKCQMSCVSYTEPMAQSLFIILDSAGVACCCEKKRK